MSGSILLAVLLTPAPTVAPREYQRTFEEAFRAEFRIEGIKACVTSATRAASAGMDAMPVCACVADKLLSTKTVEELSRPPVKTELEAMAAECVSTHLPAGRGSAEAAPELR